ncbi:hypothetical protein [Peribacillus sp. NPDC096540]|uniref:hypothetical protein n=1 Tax=Peribacillus sp. NPDC096540 TaxID=3390612 RepID=UPI003CFF05C8
MFHLIVSQNQNPFIEEEVRKVIENACTLTVQNAYLPSGTGNDANHLARIPIEMILFQYKDGRSHCPEE